MLGLSQLARDNDKVPAGEHRLLLPSDTISDKNTRVLNRGPTHSTPRPQQSGSIVSEIRRFVAIGIPSRCILRPDEHRMQNSCRREFNPHFRADNKAPVQARLPDGAFYYFYHHRI
jgi:hypothetical protein